MRISVLFRGSLHQLNGAARVVKMFDTHKNIFEEEGIAFENMFTYDCVNQESYSETRTVDSEKRKKTNDAGGNNGIKAKIAGFLHNTYVGSCASIEWLHVRRAKELIGCYLQSDMGEDVLIIHDAFTCYEYLKTARKAGQKKKVIFVHHNTGDEWKSLRLYFPKIVNTAFDQHLEKIAKYCYDTVDAIVFVSDTSKENFLHLRGKEYSRKIHVIKNGINDIGEPPVRNFDTLRLITVGTVNERKNQLNLIKCLSEIGDREIHLTVVGEGSTYEKCRQYIEEHSMQEAVDMLGKRTDIPQLLEQSNAFIMTSLGEGLPIAGIEAIRSGLPVILTDVGGNKELVDGNGFLIGTDNDSIRAAIVKMKNSNELMPDMSKKSRELFLQKFDSRKMMLCYCNLVKQIGRN